MAAAYPQHTGSRPQPPISSETPDAKRDRCVREAQVEFLSKATIVWALSAASVYGLHRFHRGFNRKIDWRPKVMVVALSGLSIGYWSVHHEYTNLQHQHNGSC